MKKQPGVFQGLRIEIWSALSRAGLFPATAVGVTVMPLATAAGATPSCTTPLAAVSTLQGRGAFLRLRGAGGGAYRSPFATLMRSSMSLLKKFGFAFSSVVVGTAGLGIATSFGIDLSPM